MVLYLSDWKDIALAEGGFRAWLAYYGLDDNVVNRPTEQRALVQLEVEARTGTVDERLARLSPLELQVLKLERYFMANFRSSEFRSRYGHRTPGEKYAWIAGRMNGLAPLQVSAILEDVTYALRALSAEIAAEAVLAEMLAQGA
jgi:hypothetical protein